MTLIKCSWNWNEIAVFRLKRFEKISVTARNLISDFLYVFSSCDRCRQCVRGPLTTTKERCSLPTSPAATLKTRTARTALETATTPLLATGRCNQGTITSSTSPPSIWSLLSTDPVSMTMWRWVWRCQVDKCNFFVSLFCVWIEFQVLDIVFVLFLPYTSSRTCTYRPIDHLFFNTGSHWLESKIVNTNYE